MQIAPLCTFAGNIEGIPSNVAPKNDRMTGSFLSSKSEGAGKKKPGRAGGQKLDVKWKAVRSKRQRRSQMRHR